MVSISDRTSQLPTYTPYKISIPSTDVLARSYGMCIYRDCQDKLFYAPQDPSIPLSWAGVAFNGMDVRKMLEPDLFEIPVEFSTKNIFRFRFPKPPHTVRGTVEWFELWEERYNKNIAKAPKCYTCGLRINDTIEDMYDDVGNYIGCEIVYSCDCDIMWDYMDSFTHPTRRSAKHPTGRSIKHSKKRPIKYSKH